MFCFQCQEAAKNQGCTIKGMCGKENTTANLQDLLIYNLKGIAVIAESLKAAGTDVPDSAPAFMGQALFTTITNANFNDENLIDWIMRAQAVKNELADAAGEKLTQGLHHSAGWYSDDPASFQAKAETVGVMATEDEDVRSLRELLILGLKGVAAYADHAAVLGVEKQEIWDFLIEGMASTTKDLPLDDMVGLVLKCGEVAVTTMAALDEANTNAYGHPELSEVNIGVGSNPGILISGHDLKDMEELLEQTRDTGVDIYTHGEMLPANYYPAFKKYAHLKGNYGGSWWHQNTEFQAFNGPILLTTNCLVPLKKENTYLDRLYTTGVPSYPGATATLQTGPEAGQKISPPSLPGPKPAHHPRKLKQEKLLAGLHATRCWPLPIKWWMQSKPGPLNALWSWQAATAARKAETILPKWPKPCPRMP